ncbi:S1 family peptidase [Falsiroseomonas ponticola]|uniref:S1 family peptidase n=1 Tax=Falsiroseomonas ponticola TaxID=2786951 RepID=UPI0019345900|nr:serine protease [Roseomonas ponticola]
MRVAPLLRMAWLAPRLAPWLALGLLLSLAGCARLPAEEARATPAAAVAAWGFAALSSHGAPLGSAVAVAPGRLLTSAHLLPAGVTVVEARRGDGVGRAEARVLARSVAMDLAVLAVPVGVFEPVPVAPRGPEAGDRLWALGAPSAGPAMAVGVVTRPAAVMPGRGEGFTARIGALMGYSGGPALDQAGRLHGLVTALPGAGGATVLAALTGMDLDGIARGPAGREVFFLSIEAAMRESERIAPSAPLLAHHAVSVPQP